MKHFIDHANRRVYIKANASNDETRASQAIASNLGYAIVYLMVSLRVAS